MTDDRVYPSTKPILNPPSSHQTLNGGGGGGINNNNNNNNNNPPSFPPTKSQLYGASRPTYRPQPKEYKRSRRSCCCSCCLWTTVIIIALILLTAITGVVFYVIYRPHRPSFSVTTLRIPQFNITTSKDSTQHLNSKLDLTITARNPNKKVIFYYDPIIVSVKSNGVDIGDGSLPSFIHGTKNTTLLKASLTSSSGGGGGGARELDSVSAKSLNLDLKKKSGLPLDIQLDTKVKVKMGGLKTNKVMIRVSCSGIQAQVATKTSKASVISSSNVDCKVKLRIKIWKWTIG